MKTNHRRSFKDPGSFRDRSCQTIATSTITGKSTRIGNDFIDSHRGHARSVRGAKKFIRTRDRIAHKLIAQREFWMMITAIESGDDTA